VRYLLLFCGTIEGQRAYDALDDAALAERFGQVRVWFDTYGDKLGARGQLQPPGTATTVHLDRGEAPLVTDGPFLEGNACGSTRCWLCCTCCSTRAIWPATRPSGRTWRATRSG
jgi:hypothetical protein